MPREISRRKLISYGVFGGISIAGGTYANFRSTEPDVQQHSPDDGLDLSVERVVRIDESLYEVTFSYVIRDDVTVVRSGFVEGAMAGQPPTDLQSGQNTFTVHWRPNGDDDRLVWNVVPSNGESRRAATRTHERLRKRWTLTLSQLEEKFQQFDPTALAVRTKPNSELTVHLHRERGAATFRIRSNGLVNYETDGMWWEVDVSLETLIPTASFTDVADDAVDAHQEDIYTFTIANSPYGGSQRMSHVLTEGTHWGANVFRFFPSHGRGSPGLDPDQPDEVYSSLRIYLGEEWKQPSAGDTCKIYWAGCNLSAGGAGKGGQPPTGDDGWSVRVYLNGPDDDGNLSIGSYVYHLDQNGRFGDLWEWPDRLTIGEWHRLDCYIRLNTISNGTAHRDGLLRTYLDGSLQERRFLRWRTTEALGFDRLGPGSYWGGSETSPRDNTIYYDDFQFDVGRSDL